MKANVILIGIAALFSGVALANTGTPATSKGAAAPSSPPAIIESRPDALIKQFVYDPSVVHEIRTRAGMFTHIEVPKGEKILGFYISDTTFWKYVVAQDGARVLVRPSEAGRYNSGTMVTDKRVYELAFRSFATEEPYWYQRVQWAVEPEIFHGWGVFADPAERALARAVERAAEVAKTESAREEKEQQQDWLVDMQRANFGYRVLGSEPFAPSMVFDDGVFTYLRFPPLQDMPVIFVYDTDPGKTRIVDYVVRGNNVLVHRVAEGGLLLKLGERSVVVERIKQQSR